MNVLDNVYLFIYLNYAKQVKISGNYVNSLGQAVLTL
jgi:hypothetical protein